ncbi:hypothetical protein EDD85DRAFT_786775 [Armillaria nabsnona]|nr:hypothetical protein EDD85DRAFT_786775 [Armillaria nabsnona]
MQRVRKTGEVWMTERLRAHYITSCDNLCLVITDFRPTETLTSKMVNPTGRNGTDNGTVPLDDQLQVALQMYEIEGLPIKERLGRLEAEFGYCIKSIYYYCKCYTFTYSRERKKKLNTLNNKFGILSTRKTSKTISIGMCTAEMDQKPSNGFSQYVASAFREHDPFGAAR